MSVEGRANRIRVLEDYSSEALNRIRSLLQERVQRCGNCQISSDTLRKVLKKWFRLSGPFMNILYYYVEGYFVGAGIIRVWSVIEKQQKRLIVFEIDTEMI